MKTVDYKKFKQLTSIEFDHAVDLEIALGACIEEDIPGDEDGLEVVVYPKNERGRYQGCGGHPGYVTRISPRILTELGFTDEELDPYLFDYLETAIEFDLPIKKHCLKRFLPESNA